MIELYDKIRALIPTDPSAPQPLHGWAEFPKAIYLASMVLAMKPKIIVEIGVWGGRSFFPMALACQQLGEGYVIGVDPWSPDESAKDQDDANKTWWKEVANHELVYQHFDYHLKKLKLAGITEIHKVKSDDFDPPSSVDLSHIDGNHGPQAIRDIKKMAAVTSRYGLIILDDVSWSGGNVKHGADWLKENGFIELHPLGTGAVYMKI